VPEGMTVLANSPHGSGQFLAVGVLEGDVEQPGVAQRRWYTTLTHNRVERDMVMGVPGGQERQVVGDSSGEWKVTWKPKRSR
jgi:hypothetical protein